MKRHIKTGIKLLITIGIFYFLFNRFNLTFSRLFLNIEWFPYLLIGLLIRLVLIQSIFIFRWQLFLKHSGIEENFFTLVKIGFQASFYGILLPSSQGNDIMRMYFIERRHKNLYTNKTSSSSVLIERMLGIVLLALTGLMSSILIPPFPNKEKVVFLIGIITLCIICLIIFLTNRTCYAVVARLISGITILKRATGFVEKTHFSMVAFPYKKVLIPAIILIFLLQIGTITIVYLVFRSVGVNLPFYQHLSFFPIITILSVLPVSISGLGLREGFFVYFYSLVGVSPEVAVGVSLVNYALQTLSPACIGGLLNLFNPETASDKPN